MNNYEIKRLLFSLLVLSDTIFAGKLEVTADVFSSKESEGKAYFTGHATVKKDGSDIKSNRVIVTFDQKKTIIKYETDGNTTFTIKRDKMNIKGSCDKVTYTPLEDVYTLKGDVVVNDTDKNRTLYGESIIIDNNKSYFKIVGKKNRPAKIVFEVK